MVMLAGTCAAAVLLLVIVTTAPPAGALPLRKSVAGILLPPFVPLTLGDTDNSTTSALGFGPRFSQAVLVVFEPDVEPVTLIEVALITEPVVIVKLFALFPAGMVTLGGTCAAESLLDRK